MIAHIGGVPLEEGLPFVSGAGTGLLLVARAWIGRGCGAGRRRGR